MSHDLARMKGERKQGAWGAMALPLGYHCSLVHSQQGVHWEILLTTFC